MRGSKGYIWKLLGAAAIPLLLAAFASLAALGAAGVGGPPTDGDGTDGEAVGSTQTDCGAGGQCEADPSLDGGEDNECFLTVLTHGSSSYIVLNEHVSDPDMPEGGVAGNQNALDKICFKPLNRSAADTTLVPGDGEDAPGKSENAPGQSADRQGESDGPGKSEDAPGDPDASGQAEGQGQANADENGNGPSGSSGRGKP